MYASSESWMIDRCSDAASGSDSGVWFANSRLSSVLPCVAFSDDDGASSSRWYIMIWQADS